MIAQTPAPPYYAVIFTSVLNDDIKGYEETAQQMLSLASGEEGFLGIESAREGTGITVSYWKDLDSIRKWKMHSEHRIAQQTGRSEWYKDYKTRICLVERDYSKTNSPAV